MNKIIIKLGILQLKVTYDKRLAFKKETRNSTKINKSISPNLMLLNCPKHNPKTQSKTQNTH